MYAVGRLGSYISRGVYTVSGPFHPFGGAVDIIVVEQQDGSFKSSPWYVRFGKFQGVLKRNEKVVNICVNEVEADFHMYLDHKGEAYFLRDVEVEEDESVIYPSSSGEETDGQSSDRTLPMKSESCDYDANKSNSVTEIDVSNGKIVARTSSRRSRILGLVFGKKSMKERLGVEEDSSDVGRTNSLARAEIAADLLDVKWSTNLASGRRKKDNTPEISVPDISNGGEVQDLQINDQQRQANSVANSNVENSLDHHVSHEEIVSHDHEMSSSSQPGSQELENSVEEASMEMSCLITEHVIGTLTSTGSGLGENDEINSEMSEMVNELGVRNADHDEDGKGVTSEITIPNSEIAEIVELEAYTSKKVDENQEFDKNVVLQCSVVSEEENGADGLQSFVHCEASESSKVGLDGSGKQSGEIMYLSCGGSGEVYVHAETLHETTELKSMVNTSPETGLLSAKESLDFQELLGDKNCCNVFNDAKILESEGTSASSSSIANGYVTDTYSQMVTVGSINVSVKEVESQSFRSVSGFSNPICQVKDEKNVKDEDNSLQHPSEPVGDPQEFSDHVPTEAVNDSAPEGSEEEQFVFSDVDDFQLGGVKCMNLNSADHEEKENPSLTPENTEAVIESFDSNFELCSSPDMFVQENPPNGDEDLRQKSRILSSCINIPGSSKVPNEEVGRMVESLPDMWLNVDDLDAHDLHHSFGHSLDSNYKSSKWMLLQKECSTFVKSEADREHQFSLAQPTTDDDKILEELKDVPANPAELCSSPDRFVQENPPNGDEDLRQKSRILSSRINITGSSKVPNEEVGRMVESLPDMWLNVDDLDAHDLRLGNSLDSNYKSSKWMLLRKEFPKFVKSEADREHQFPLAQPTTDNDQILEELKDVPANPAAGDTSKAIDTSGGSWRLWPFPFKRSRSMKATQSAINSTRSTDAKITFESAIDMDGEKSVLELKVNKKKVRAITPTSEQLASLNLKEGRNTVTFTFSTAMLGNQQVDARIYLWRWDTRIVISDVDGTITKSDVLGQFMPMFGMDWSQTGVAHLFSAIKENGYQLLFLSARAISQAYHTRQFLFNLKQNGKALPDGPIVISPDGLFPSLFREVIRRAPHEFKIACLEDIKALFPPDCSPFYAGFGNRDTDEFSYLKVGIPKGKIFIINPKGQVVVNRRVDTKSYTSLHDLVHGMFPPMSSSEQEDFNSWNFWKLPVPAVDV